MLAIKKGSGIMPTKEDVIDAVKRIVEYGHGKIEVKIRDGKIKLVDETKSKN